jgi:hypothetical protein
MHSINTGRCMGCSMENCGFSRNCGCSCHSDDYVYRVLIAVLRKLDIVEPVRC